MESNVFMDKSVVPADDDLIKVLGSTYELWKNVRDYVFQQYPKAIEEWNYPGTKYGWSFRIKDKKRAIIYLLPRDMHFKTALVFGERATNAVMQSSVSNDIKDSLASAKAYAEGRGVRIDIFDEKILTDIKTLIDIKLAY
jgi:hypothetical protein